MPDSIESMILQLRNAKRVTENPPAWTWSPAPRFAFLMTMTPSDHLLQAGVKDSQDTNVPAATLRFALDHHEELESSDASIILSPGFSVPGFGFDSLVGLPGRVNRYHENFPEINERLIAVFPGFHCEVSGTESDDDAYWRFKKHFDLLNITREPVPFIRMESDNPRTGIRSLGEGRTLQTLATLTYTIEQLADSLEAFAEVENYRGQIARVEWRDGLWTSDALREPLESADEATAWARGFVLS